MIVMIADEDVCGVLGDGWMMWVWQGCSGVV